MRGQQSLFDTYTNTLVVVPKGEGHGRNKILHEARNNRLLHRYYYYIKILHRHYPYTIAKLCLEFDLSEIRVIEVLDENRDQLKEIVNTKQPTRDQLAELFPWFVW